MIRFFRAALVWFDLFIEPVGAAHPPPIIRTARCAG